MLPLRDTIRSYSFPIVNWIIIGVNTLAFLFEVNLAPQAFNRLILTFGLVPSRLHLSNPIYLVGHPQALIPLFTHMFLHGGWLHILSNMWILFIFGDNVEDRLGSARYLIFYLASGLVAGLIQASVAPASNIPAIGASGAIAGVLGAYFLLYPRARVVTLIPIFIIPWFVEIPAIFYLGFWFVSQLFSGFTSLNLPAGANMGGVAWFAHIGGFIFGLLAVRIFAPKIHPGLARRFPEQYWPD